MSPTGRFAAFLVASTPLTVGGCTSSVPASGGTAVTGQDGGGSLDAAAEASGRTDGGTTADASAGSDGDGNDPGDAIAADGRICTTSQKVCGGACVAIDDPAFGCAPATCTPCALANATATCDGQVCGIAACAAGYSDCNQIASDGCETSLSSTIHCGSCGNACPLPDHCHELGACNPSSGTCAVLQSPDGTACVAGNSCTTGDVCTAGVCGGTLPCPNGICGATLSAFDGSCPTTWTLNGVASYDATAGTVVLVPGGQLYSAGSVFYDDPIATETLTVSFDFRMTTTGGNNSRGDGIAFVMQTDGATGVGICGAGMGFAGLHGYAVELDIYANTECGDVDDNHAGVDETTPCGEGEPTPIATSPNLIDTSPTHGVGDLGDGQWRTARVALAHGQLSVSITDPVTSAFVAVPNLQGVALPGFVQSTPHTLGFSGGGGSLAGRQEIRNVQLSFPSEQCL